MGIDPDKAETIHQLEEALATRDLIGQAKGILMSTQGLTAEQAFQMLVDQSQHENVKLHVIAAELVNRHDANVRRHQDGHQVPDRT